MSNLAVAINDNVVAYTYDANFVSFVEEYLKGQRSANTEKAYRTDIKQFFKFTFGREIEFIRMSDVESLTSLEAMKYHNSLTGKNATIKRKIDAVRGLLDALAVDNPNINNKIFNNLKISKVELTRESYGNIDWDEAFLFIEYAHIEQMEGDQMAMLLKLACISSIRLQALLSLEWEKDFRTKIEKGVTVHYIDTVDKGSRQKTPLSMKFYNELRELLGTSGKLFPKLYEHKVGKFLKEILAYFEIDEKRNIKFHSFKKCGVNRVLLRTGDLTKAQIQGKHKSIVTTQSSYVELKDDLTEKPSYTLDNDVDIIKAMKDVSHEDLIKAISQLGDSAQYELLRIINKG